MPDTKTLLTLLVIAFVTAALRFLPFLVFGGKLKTPKIIEKLGKTLPFAIMGILVIYCLKSTNFTAFSGWLPPLIACAVTALLHIWKRNTLLSIVVGTVSYMLLIQFIFV